MFDIDIPVYRNLLSDPQTVPESPCIYKRPENMAISMAISIIIGTIISYIPQYYSLWRRKTVEGLSFSTVALGTASSLCVCSNYLYLKWQSKSVCCNIMSSSHCFFILLDGLQLFGALICHFVLTFFWVFYFKVIENDTILIAPEEIRERVKHKRFLFVICLTMAGVILFNAIIAMLLNNVLQYRKTADTIGGLFGIASGLIVIIQWAPQIYMTWKLQQLGTLSIVMLLIQTPGSLSVVYFQAVMSKASWTTWLPYAIGSTQFTILLILCLFIIFKDWYRRKKLKEYTEQHGDFSLVGDENTIPSKRSIPQTPHEEVEAEQMVNLSNLDSLDQSDDEMIPLKF